MKLSTIIDNLLIGEFAQLGIKSELAALNYTHLIPSLNMGLTALHKRFALVTDEVYIQQYDHISTYRLRTKYAATSGSTESIKYIDDSLYSPFDGSRLIAVTAIVDELGKELRFNDNNASSGVYMPSYDTIQCSAPISDNVWRVVYTKDHERIVITNDFDPEEIEIEIPEAYLEPLLYFIAARSHSGTGTLDQVNEANSYLAKYELACAALSNYGLIQRDNLTNMKLENNGWV